MITVTKKYKDGNVRTDLMEDWDFNLYTQFTDLLSKMQATKCDTVIVTMDVGLQVLFTLPEVRTEASSPAVPKEATNQ